MTKNRQPSFICHTIVGYIMSAAPEDLDSKILSRGLCSTSQKRRVSKVSVIGGCWKEQSERKWGSLFSQREKIAWNSSPTYFHNKDSLAILPKA